MEPAAFGERGYCAQPPGANLKGAFLTHADLQGANLREADLRDANLTGADLMYADLTDANLMYADLRGANFTGANLTDAVLWGANVYGIRNPQGGFLPKAVHKLGAVCFEDFGEWRSWRRGREEPPAYPKDEIKLAELCGVSVP